MSETLFISDLHLSAAHADTVERFVTASLHVDYLAPTPIDTLLELRGRVKESKGRKMVVSVTLFAQGKETARGEVVAIQMPEHFVSKQA